jgi:microcystin-dependent protein
MATIAGIHSSGAPAGTILPCGNATALPGTLLCQGQAVSRTTYAALFAAIGTAYGIGDGSTTFNLPNTQGYFLRGAGTTGIYSTTRGTVQDDRLQGHRHANDGVNYLFGTSGLGYQANNGPQAQQRQFQVGNPSNDGSNGDPRTASETRPANVGVNYCIAY